MRQTYELYLEAESGERRFEPFLCDEPTELVRSLRAMLEARTLASIEVRRAGETLFILAR